MEWMGQVVQSSIRSFQRGKKNYATKAGIGEFLGRPTQKSRYMSERMNENLQSDRKSVVQPPGFYNRT